MLRHCGLCGEAFPPSDGTCATGYAHTNDGVRICYYCADGMQVNALQRETQAFGYLQANAAVTFGTDDPPMLTTWTGGILARVTALKIGKRRYTPTGGSYELWHGQATDVHGKLWSFTSPGPGMYARMRRMGE